MNPIGRRTPSLVLSSNETSCSTSVPTETQNCYGRNSEESTSRYGNIITDQQWPIHEAYMVTSNMENDGSSFSKCQSLINLNIPEEMDDVSGRFHRGSGRSCLYPIKFNSSVQFVHGESSSNNIRTEADYLCPDNTQSNSNMLCSCPVQAIPAPVIGQPLIPMSELQWFALRNERIGSQNLIQDPFYSTHNHANFPRCYAPTYEVDHRNPRNMRGQGFGHPMYLSDARQDSVIWNVRPNYGLNPYLRTFQSSNGHLVPSFSWSSPPLENSSNWQRHSASPSWSLSPPMEAEVIGYPSLSTSERHRGFRRRPNEEEYEDHFFHNQYPDFRSSYPEISEIRHILSAISRGEHVTSEIRQAFSAIMIGEELSEEEYLLFDPVQRHDRHRDMRLDVDNMSYEELLALEERMGNVSTGLSDDSILKLMKGTKFSSLNRVDKFGNSHEPCCICQEEFLNEEHIGGLSCGHTFHFDCIKKWLNVKNLCPICKLNGLPT